MSTELMFLGMADETLRRIREFPPGEPQDAERVRAIIAHALRESYRCGEERAQPTYHRLFRELMTFMAAGYEVRWRFVYTDDQQTSGLFRVDVKRESSTWSAQDERPETTWERLKTAMVKL